MATETGRNTRTIRGYLAGLLEYPRWLIERDVDFSECRARGHYNEYLSDCLHCRFGDGCRWLDRHRTPSTGEASVDELVQALRGAVDYLQSPETSAHRNSTEARNWMREARRFLSAHRD